MVEPISRKPSNRQSIPNRAKKQCASIQVNNQKHNRRKNIRITNEKSRTSRKHVKHTNQIHKQTIKRRNNETIQLKNQTKDKIIKPLS